MVAGCYLTRRKNAALFVTNNYYQKREEVNSNDPENFLKIVLVRVELDPVFLNGVFSCPEGKWVVHPFIISDLTSSPSTPQPP
jgi:hypothetical protein